MQKAQLVKALDHQCQQDHSQTIGMLLGWVADVFHAVAILAVVEIAILDLQRLLARR